METERNETIKYIKKKFLMHRWREGKQTECMNEWMTGGRECYVIESGTGNMKERKEEFDYLHSPLL